MIFDLIRQSLGSSEVDQISSQLGTKPQQTQQAIAAALPLLLGALDRNSTQPQGAAALANALERDHDGSILDNLAGFLGQGDTSPGDGILKHVLGERRQNVEAGLGQASGLEGQSVSKLLALLAPIVMGALGKEKRNQHLDPGGLSGLLRTEVSSTASSSQLGGLMALLDSNQDGQVADDIARMGSQLLSSLFNKK
jgi:hypothetical protein